MMKNFGREIKLAITNFGLSLENIQQRCHDWNEESKALGLVSDEEKLKILKGDLYRKVRSSVSDTLEVQKLTDAIQLFEEIKHAEFERKLAETKQRLSLSSQVEASCNVFIMLLIMLVAGSFLATYKCGSYDSQFCSNARVIPTQITRYFYK